MHKERNAQGMRRAVLRALAVACLVVAGASAAFGQEEARSGDAPKQEEEFAVSELLKLPGKVVGKGANTTPKGHLKLRSFRVEEVALPRVTNAEVRGQRLAVTKAFRLVITGEEFPVRALPAVVWVDDVAVGYGIESEDLTEITVVTYDESLLREGATLYLSYGDKENKEGRTAVPDKLKLDAKGGDQ